MFSIVQEVKSSEGLLFVIIYYYLLLLITIIIIIDNIYIYITITYNKIINWSRYISIHCLIDLFLFTMIIIILSFILIYLNRFRIFRWHSTFSLLYTYII